MDCPWCVQVGVTQLTEARMARRPERAELFREYVRTTSMWVPWFKAQPKVGLFQDKDD